MDASLLKTLLQVHLATDVSSAYHIPFILRALNKQCFLVNTLTPKWIIRVNALLHSKTPAGRWAGLCLAWKTAIINEEITIQQGHSWLTVSQHLICVRCSEAHRILFILNHPQKPGPDAIKIWAIALCRTIFVHSQDYPEFQRQTVHPTLPKFIALLVSLLQEGCSQQLKASLMSHQSEGF
jgi:hypothetical protein